MPQFLINQDPKVDEMVSMPASEAHHLRDVFRVRTGAQVRLFNGAGIGYEAYVENLSRDEVLVKICNRWVEKPSRVKIDCAVALLPRDAMLQVVQRVTELGINRLIPLKTDRSIVKNSPNFEQWEKASLAACKQSERLSLPKLEKPVAFKQLADQLKLYDCVLLAQPQKQKIRKILESDSVKGIESVLALVGPEGGFSDAEVEYLESQGAIGVSLGSNIYRAEVAVAYLASVLNSRFEV